MSMNTILLWIGIVLGVISVYKMYLSRKMKGFHPKELYIGTRAYQILLIVAVLVALFVRAYKFGLVPGGFNQDGAMAAVDAKALAEYGTDRFGMRFPVHLTAWGYGQMSSLLSYLMVPFIKMFGLSPYTARLPLLLISLAGLGFLYGFVRDVFGKNVGLIALWFAAINPWHILQSRWALDCNLYSHFFMAGIFFLNRAFLRKKRRRYLMISMLIFGLCMYCYGVSIYTMPVFLLTACVYLLATKKLTIKDAVLSMVAYLLVAWPFITVMAINFFHLDTIETPLFTLPYFPDSIRSGDILFFTSDIFPQLAENFNSLFRVTVFQSKDLPWNDVENFGTMYLFSLPFAAAGLGGLLHEFRRKTGTVLLAIFLGTGVWCGLMTNGVNVNRINIIYYPIMILVGIGIYEVIRWISLPYLKYGIAAVYGGAFILFARVYFTSYADEIAVYFRRGLGEAITALRESEAEKIYITVGPRQNPVAVEILTLFWCDLSAAYFQGKATPEGWLPYDERYIYHDSNDILVNPAENADYVILAEEWPLFDESQYEFEEFGGYYAVTKKQD